VPEELPGFVDARFDIPAGTAVVRGAVDPQVLAEVLTRPGYPATPEDALRPGCLSGC
jgi:hypothetical protein